MKIIKEKSKEGYFLEVDFQYPEYWHNVQNNLPFLPERIKLNFKLNFYHIRNLQQALNHVLVLKIVSRVIQFTQRHG